MHESLWNKKKGERLLVGSHSSVGPSERSVYVLYYRQFCFTSTDRYMSVNLALLALDFIA